MIDGATRLLAIVGDPIEHARSPAVINALLARSGRNAILVPWHAPAAQFRPIMDGLMLTGNVFGIVVTYPFKQQAMALASTIRPAAARVGALNALRREAGGWTGDMFDGAGLVRAVLGLGRPVAGAKVKLLGAGGAGSAIAYALAEAGAASLSIFDVDRARAASLAGAVGRHVPGCAVSADDAALGGAEVLVNATPVGLHPADGLPAPMDGLSAGTAVVDIVPRQEGTPLLALARERGCPHAGGAAMVEGQAAALLDFFGLGAPDVGGPPA